MTNVPQILRKSLRKKLLVLGTIVLVFVLAWVIFFADEKSKTKSILQSSKQIAPGMHFRQVEETLGSPPISQKQLPNNILRIYHSESGHLFRICKTYYFC